MQTPSEEIEHVHGLGLCTAEALQGRRRRDERRGEHQERAQQQERHLGGEGGGPSPGRRTREPATRRYRLHAGRVGPAITTSMGYSHLSTAYPDPRRLISFDPILHDE